MWFNTQAEEAANFYTSIFSGSKILSASCYYDAGAEASGMPRGSVMVVEFELEGQQFRAINGGPQFKFSPVVSFTVNCETQEELDHYWERLSEGGDAGAQQCGWLADKFGLSWQVVPNELGRMLSSGDRVQANRVMQALLSMKKIDINGLRTAFEKA